MFNVKEMSNAEIQKCLDFADKLKRMPNGTMRKLTDRLAKQEVELKAEQVWRASMQDGDGI